MGTTSEKLTYLNTTKSKIKEVINMTDVGIIDDTFRSYPQKLYDGYINILKDINTLVDNIPQNTYTGTSVDLENTLDLPPTKTILTKESTQNGTPTPSNPIEIKTVKGYKNFVDISDGEYEHGGYTNTGNKNTANTDIRSTNYIEVKPNTTYILSANTICTNMRLVEFDENKVFKKWTSNVVVNRNTITTGSSTKYLMWNINYNNSALSDLQMYQVMHEINLLLIESQEILPYIFYGDNAICLKNVGKNKYNKHYVSFFRNNSTDFKNETLDGNSIYTRSNSFEIKGGKTYTISGIPSEINLSQIRTYNENKEYIASITTNTFFLNENVKYINLLFAHGSYAGRSFYNIMMSSNFQIEEGTEATTYEESKDYPVILLNDNEVVGINNNKDELIIDFDGKCKLNKKTAKIDSYNGETITTDYMSTTGGLDTGATVYYVLDTPQLIDLQQKVNLSLYDGVNTITNSENANMEIKYIKDTYE